MQVNETDTTTKVLDVRNYSVSRSYEQSKVWSQTVSRLNNITGLIIFPLSIIELWFVREDIRFFVYLSVPILILFTVFYFYENKVLRYLFSDTQSKSDIWLLALVIFRNFIFISCFVPLAQFIGWALLYLLAIPYLIIYIISVRSRSRNARRKYL